MNYERTKLSPARVASASFQRDDFRQWKRLNKFNIDARASSHIRGGNLRRREDNSSLDEGN